MNNNLYRDTSIKRISSPEQLNDYLKVTKPGVWIVLVAVVTLLAGVLVWGIFINIGSHAYGTAEVKNGTMTVYFDDARVAKNITEGMVVEIEGSEATITRMETDRGDEIRAVASTDIKDGSYAARVCYMSSGLIRVLFGR